MFLLTFIINNVSFLLTYILFYLGWLWAKWGTIRWGKPSPAGGTPQGSKRPTDNQWKHSPGRLFFRRVHRWQAKLIRLANKNSNYWVASTTRSSIGSFFVIAVFSLVCSFPLARAGRHKLPNLLIIYTALVAELKWSFLGKNTLFPFYPFIELLIFYPFIELLPFSTFRWHIWPQHRRQWVSR